jgi:hypothetical protein
MTGAKLSYSVKLLRSSKRLVPGVSYTASGQICAHLLDRNPLSNKLSGQLTSLKLVAGSNDRGRVGVELTLRYFAAVCGGGGFAFAAAAGFAFAALSAASFFALAAKPSL